MLTAGTTVGPYEILELLGAGGMGEVYRARDPRIGREVAIKVLPSGFAGNEDHLRRFLQESRTLGGLNHPNLVTLFDVGEFEGNPYLVMELLEGDTLRQKLTGKPLAPKRVVEIAKAVAEGLSAAHNRGIVHRDLKPENIFITRDGRVKVLDFGLAKLLEHAVGSESETRAVLSEPGTVLGTSGYMSPEQVHGSAVDARSDLFSLGLISLEMLVGVNPFQKKSRVESMHAILKDDPPEFDPALKVPPVLERIVHTCLVKEPEGRFHSAHDLAFALGTMSSASSSGSSPALAGPPLVRVNRWQLLAAGAVGLLLMATLGTGLAWRLRAPVTLNIKPLTELPMLITQARYLPDGKGVVFSAINDEGIEELFSATGQERPRPLGIKNAHLCSVSPSGELAILLVDKVWGGVGTLAIVPAGGAGAPREVEKDVGAAEWGPDGHTLAIKWFRYKGEAVQALEYPKGNLLYRVPYGHGLGSFALSPEDGRIAFVESIGGSEQQIGIADAKGIRFLNRKQLPGLDSLSYTLRWWKRTIIATGVGQEGSRVLIEIDADTLALKTLHPTWFPVEAFDTAADGRILVKGPMQSSAFLHWVVPGEKKERRIDWSESQAPAAFDSTGRRLLFTTIDSRLQHKLWLLKEGEAVPLCLGEGRYGAQFSPDEQSVAVMAPAPGGDYQIRIYPVGAGSARTLPGFWASGVLSFFKDGNQVLISNATPRGSVQRGTYTQRLDGSEATPFGAGRAISGPLSPDGEWCFVRESWNVFSPVSLYHLPNGEITTFQGLLPMSISIRRWSSDGRGFYWSPLPSGVTTDPTLHYFDLAQKRDRHVFTPPPVKPGENVYNLTPSPNGKAFAYQVAADTKTRLMEVTLGVR